MPPKVQLTRDGVELIVMGFDKFMADLDKSGAKWDKTVNRFRDATGRFVKGTQVGPAFDKMRGQLASARDALDQLAQGMKKPETGFKLFAKNAAFGAGEALGLKTALGALTGGTAALGLAAGAAAIKIGQKLVGALKDAARAAGQLLAESLHLAGSFEEMELTALAVGRAMGLDRETIEGASAAIQDLGIRADVANKVVAQFARNNLDLASAVDLVRIAQATGIIMKRDSTEEMEALVHAAISQSTIMLRQRGIFIDNEVALQKYADSIGRHVESLNMQEEAQARLNAIIEAGKRVLDVYEAAMKSPTKQLRTFVNRELKDLKVALGAPFLDAWAGAIGIVRDFTIRLTEMISEGGALYPLLIKLGAAASLFVDGLRKGYDAIILFIEGIEFDMGSGMMEVAENAFSWGVEIVAQLAEGMTSAATGALTAVMNAISNLLSYWLSPGSPPNIAPNLDKWGMAAMTSYLQGFTSADFDILEGIQAPLSKILEGPAFADVSKSLAKALAGDDRASFLDIVSGATDMFGEEVTKLAKKQFKLADATEAVKRAELDLADARERVTSSQKKVNKLTEQYNTLLRSGASRSVLDAQLKRINAAEKQRDLAVDQIGGSEEELKLAKKREDRTKEEATLQQRLLDQILGVNDALVDREKGITGVKGVKGKIGKVAGILPEPADFDIVSRMAQAIKDAKLELKGKFADMFKPLHDAFAQMKLDLAGVGKAWDKFALDVGDAWDRLKIKFPMFQELEDFLLSIPEKVEDVKKAFTPLLSDAWEEIVSFWENDLKPTWEDFNELVGNLGVTALELFLGALGLNLEGLQGIWEFIKEEFVPTWDDVLLPAIERGIEKFFDPLSGSLEALSGWLNTVSDGFGILGRVIDRIDVSKILAFIGRSPSPLEKGLRGINDALSEMSSSRFQLPAPTPTHRMMGGGSSIDRAGDTTVFDQRRVTVPIGPVNNPSLGPAQMAAYLRRTVRQEFG